MLDLENMSGAQIMSHAAKVVLDEHEEISGTSGEWPWRREIGFYQDADQEVLVEFGQDGGIGMRVVCEGDSGAVEISADDARLIAAKLVDAADILDEYRASFLSGFAPETPPRPSARPVVGCVVQIIHDDYIASRPEDLHRQGYVIAIGEDLVTVGLWPTVGTNLGERLVELSKSCVKVIA
jgi:hypothetical protein